ncbi:MAG: response regulator transcription factor [Candidatus Krumholzibacteria bacterium]|nr:response regulator transcription factor [Candidatus Krumholzibacteria bacterium]
MAIKVIVVDDEQLARDEMRFLLSQEKDIEVVAEASGGREAISLVREKKPDVVFLDIQMPEMNGFQVVRELVDAGAPPLIIFATAYDSYAIKAFEVNALDYLLKPINRQRLGEALARARRAMPQRGEFERRLRALAGGIRIGTSFLPRIVVRTGEEPILVDIERVAMLRREGGRVTAYTAEGKFSTNYRDLDEVEIQIDPALFIRLGVDYLINIRMIADVVPWSGGNFMMTMQDADKTEVRLNRSQAKLLKSKAERFF